MAFKAIVLDQSNSEGELPWLTDYIKQVPNCVGKTFQVRLVSFSPKGVMITTSHFKGFLFRSNPYYEFLFEAVKVWSDNNQPVAALVALVEPSLKSKFQLGIEDELESDWTKKTETTFMLKLGSLGLVSTPKGLNPLLAVSSTSALTKQAGKKGRGQRNGGQNGTRKAAVSLANAFPGSELIEDSEPDDEWDGEAPSDL